MTIYEKMHSGAIYYPGDPDLLREIGEHDREYYFKDRKIDYTAL